LPSHNKRGAVEKIKKMMSSMPILAIPNADHKFQIKVDALVLSMGCDSS